MVLLQKGLGNGLLVEWHGVVVHPPWMLFRSVISWFFVSQHRVISQVKHKYDQTVMSLFAEVFNWLPLAATLNGGVFVTHGGLPAEDGSTLDDIAAVKCVSCDNMCIAQCMGW